MRHLFTASGEGREIKVCGLFLKKCDLGMLMRVNSHRLAAEGACRGRLLALALWLASIAFAAGVTQQVGGTHT